MSMDQENTPLYNFSKEYKAAVTGKVYVRETDTIVDPSIDAPLNQWFLRELPDWALMSHDRDNFFLEADTMLNIVISMTTGCAEIRKIVCDKYEVNFMHLAAAYDARPGLTEEDRLIESMIGKMATALQVDDWETLRSRTMFRYAPPKP